MRIAFDIDGTILKPDVRIEKIKTINPNFEWEMYDEYPMWKSLKKYGIINESFDKEAFYKEHREAMMSEGSFFDCFKELYWELIEKGHEVYFVTARRLDAIEFTRKLFSSNGIPFENVHFVGEKASKVPCLKRLNIDVLFEDNIKVTEDVLSKTNLRVMLLERPYNKNFSSNSQNFKKIKNFDESSII